MSCIRHLYRLEVGDRVLFRDRKMPLTVTTVHQIDEYDGGIHYVWEVELLGPQTGRVLLKESTSGRIMAYPRGEEPEFRPKRLRYFTDDSR